jgi:site-specific DNA-cytosine methylase
LNKRYTCLQGYKMYSQFVPMRDGNAATAAAAVEAAAEPSHTPTATLAAAATASGATAPGATASASAAAGAGATAVPVAGELIPFRFLTPRECARLQGFPDTFRLTGKEEAEATEATAATAAATAAAAAAEDEADDTRPPPPPAENGRDETADGNSETVHEKPPKKVGKRAVGEQRLVIPEGAQYSAVGNAVAPPMIEAIARALLGTLLHHAGP